MEMLQKLQDCFYRYEKKVEKVRANSSPLAGLFGFGGGVKNDSCHEEYYEEVSACCAELAAACAPEEEVYTCVRYLLTGAAEHDGKEDVYGMLIAIHGCAKPLIPLLSREHKKQLLAFYQDAYPRITRLPVQDQVIKLLKK